MNAYSYTGGVELSFFNAQTVWKLFHGQSLKECIFLHAPNIKEWKLLHSFIISFLHAPYIDHFNIEQRTFKFFDFP